MKQRKPRKRCELCKHWWNKYPNQKGDIFDSHPCLKADDGVKNGFGMENSDEGCLSTGRYFGCVLFEPKKQKKPMISPPPIARKAD